MHKGLDEIVFIEIFNMKQTCSFQNKYFSSHDWIKLNNPPPTNPTPKKKLKKTFSQPYRHNIKR